MSIKHQVSINATETVNAKLTFEREDKSQGLMRNVENLNWAPISQRRVNMGFGKGYSTQGVLIMNIINGLRSLQFRIVGVELALA